MKSTTFSLALVASFVAVSLAQQSSFCHIKSCKSQPHTLCKFAFEKPSRACGKVVSSQVTQQEKDEIISVHNKLRKKVASGQEKRGHPGPQPAAKSMPDLTWSNELQGIAQTWADQCINDHDKCRDLPNQEVGQNIFWGSAGGPNDISLTFLMQGWYDEVKHVNPKIVKKYVFKEEYAHYTQIVWAKTTQVGCGVIRYTKTHGEDYEIFFVCNYGPSGNVETLPMYETK
ncbi:venom allergen 5-like [Venturia canescens]|uniref:venom allergen 5-like n=1 Tax=Venturia canescens TaxID=32260 RepID=UPI001C9C88D3|nr:venom allergen 5-like [Venturia canescens]XP_043287981.1 venom allergen 5-like [Venturia canescens]